MSKFDHISKLFLVGAFAVSVVGLVLAARWFSSPAPVSTDLEASSQAWDATSTHPSFNEIDNAADETIEISDLPSLPNDDQWEISELPQTDVPSFQPLPKVDSPSFEPLPQLDAGQEDTGDEDFETRALPAMQRYEAKAIGVVPESSGEGVEEPIGFGIQISNSEIRDSQIGNFAPQDFQVRSLPAIGRQEAKSSYQGQKPNDLEFQISNFEIGDSQIRNSEPEVLKLESPQLGQSNPVQQIQPDFADFSLARRLRSLPTPELELDAWQHPPQPEAQEYPVAMASAELEISGPKISIPNKTSAKGFSGASVGDLPKQLADRIAAIEPKKPKKKKKVVAAPKKGEKKAPPKKSSKDDYKLAAQPEIGDHWAQDKPLTDSCSHLIEPLVSDFSSDPFKPYLPYDAGPQMNVYQGKTLNANQRPLVELGRPWYQLGQLSPGTSVLGFHNNVTPQFLIFGDSRVAYASNNQNGGSDSLIATQLNLNFDLKLTGTERFHAFVSPTGGAQHNRYLLDEDRFVFEGDANIDFGFFEGDLGAIVGGAIGKTLPFDLPFTVGIIPLVFQNGVWLDDAFLGFAATLPAKNSPRFNISNMDITFFAGYDKVTSDAFPGDDSAARVIGVASFIEALNGYIEADYAFLDDRTFDDRSYHNIGIGYTRRYGRFLSNSTRVIVNAGQSTDAVENTADGVLLLSENSLITGHPSNIVPYLNMFAGFDRPQSVARAGAAGGVLRNTGILFESDNLTGYPTLDATANDTYGFATGINILSENFSQQLVLETAFLGVMGDSATRNAQGDQYGVGFRYQLPLSNSVIFRADGMVGFLRNDEDISGIRLEMRKKF